MRSIMTKRGWIGGWLFALAGVVSAQAQVNVEVVMSQAQYLPSEAIQIIVRVENRSGKTIHFGNEEWLKISMEGLNGYVVTKQGDPAIGHDFDVGNGATAVARMDLEPNFAITKNGRYNVVATVELKDWDAAVSSAPKGFDVIQGFKLWEKEFGVPEDTAHANNGQPEVRKYILQKATYLKHLRLYFRLTDATESQVYRVYPIGPMVSFTSPQTELDGQNNLHVLYEEGSRTYSYTEFNPNGELVVRQTYAYVAGPPRLKMDQAGKVLVSGAARRISSDDVPFVKLPPNAVTSSRN
jgi:hypothetical protein